jgi:hypothetical protein
VAVSREQAEACLSISHGRPYEVVEEALERLRECWGYHPMQPGAQTQYHVTSEALRCCSAGVCPSQWGLPLHRPGVRSAQTRYEEEGAAKERDRDQQAATCSLSAGQQRAGAEPAAEAAAADGAAGMAANRAEPVRKRRRGVDSEGQNDLVLASDEEDIAALSNAEVRC